MRFDATTREVTVAHRFVCCDSVRSGGSFRVISSVTAVAKRVEKLKFLTSITMDRSSEISSSEDEFDLESLHEEITAIHKELDDRENTSSDDDSDEIRGVRRRKIRIIDSEVGSSDNDAAEDQRSGSPEWISCAETEEIPSRLPFIAGNTPIGPSVPAYNKEPLDFFKLFFTDELVQEIVSETNNYARKKLENKTLSQYSIWRNWNSVTTEEMWAFLGVILNMGTMPLANLQEYWSRNDVSYIPFYSNIFTRDRFTQIFWMLHLKTIPTTDAGPRTRLQLVSCFLEYINSKFLDYFTPGEEICVDESTVKFKGRISFITYNPKKPTKWGIRIYTMADANTGYICGILPYYGSLTTEKLIRPDLPVSARIPLHLYTMLQNKVPGSQGHHMFTDRYYTSFILAEELIKLKCHLTGTILTHRKHLPIQIKKPKFGKKSTIAFRKGNTLVLSWKDKRVVTCLSNWNNAGMSSVKRILRGGVEINVKKPNVVINYIKHMGGVDRADQLAATYCFLRKSLKWWRKLFFWGLEICSINSYILYKMTKLQRGEQPLSHLRYVKTLVRQLTGDFQTRTRSSTSTANSEIIRLNGKMHIILTGGRKDCKVCSQRTEHGKRHQTTYYCDTCPEKPGIHIGNCFIKYHTKRNYKD